MAKYRDWLPHSWTANLAMCRVWISYLTADRRTEWGIPAAQFTELGTLFGEAQAALQKYQDDTQRTPVVKTQCIDAFEAQSAKMRFFKRHYFLVPPLTHADLTALGLPVPDGTRSPVVVPQDGPFFTIIQLGPGRLGIIARYGPLGRKGSKPPGIKGYRLYYGVEDPERPFTEQSQLPASVWSTLGLHSVTFRESDRGKRAFFALKWEVQRDGSKKDNESNFSEMLSEIIP